MVGLADARLLADPEDWRLADECVTGWRIGMTTAGYLSRYFPDFWQRHVAGQRVTTARLLGVFHAFVELADDSLLALDTVHVCPLPLGVEPDEIPNLIDGYRDEGGILWTLANELWPWVYRPPVLVYGIDDDELGNAWRRGEQQLCLLLWWLVRQTAWRAGELARGELLGVPGGRRIARVPALPADTPMEALADALTWSVPLPGITTPWTLGELLRLVCSQTGNEFADSCQGEVNQDMAWWCEDVYDAPSRLRSEVRKQRAARDLRAAYDALDAAMRMDPPLVTRLTDAIRKTAARVRAGHNRTLVDILGTTGPEEGVCAA